MNRIALIVLLCLFTSPAFAQEKSETNNSRNGEQTKTEKKQSSEDGHREDQSKKDESTKEAKKKLSDDQIAKILIRQSIIGYSGNCPCPYNTTSRGHRCGGRSAYSRPGGASPLCFRRDVTDAMIERYRDRHE